MPPNKPSMATNNEESSSLDPHSGGFPLTTTTTLNTNPSTATTSATSLVMDAGNNYGDAEAASTISEAERLAAFKRLNSESYKAAIQNTSDYFSTELVVENNNNNASNRSPMMQPASPSNFKSFSPKSHTPNTTTTTTNLNYHHSAFMQQQFGDGSSNFQFNLLYKRQEANFYVQQILTDLLAIGVLEYESGFDNAINRTYKVQFKFVWYG